MKSDPESQSKEIEKLKNDLEREKRQTTFLRSQLEINRTQLSAQIQNKESQIQGIFLLHIIC